MTKKNISKFLESISIDFSNIIEIIGSFQKKIYLIDNKYLIRTSKDSMENEIFRFNRVKGIGRIPHIISTGVLECEDGSFNYILLNLIPGEELFSCYQNLSISQIDDIGKEISFFLDTLHRKKTDKYDIGHYVPTIPDFSGSWKNGHINYWNYLKKGLTKINQSKKMTNLFIKVFKHFDFVADVLDYQSGSVVLHNDFHFRNIIIDNSEFSGVIDWECSQKGEADFDISHLVHWTLFSPNRELDFKPLFKSIIDSHSPIFSIPNLAERVTIYELEQDLNQIVWNSEDLERKWYKRISSWLDGAVSDIIPY